MLVSKIYGIYELFSYSFITRPKQVDHDKGVYQYFINEKDNPGKTFSWVVEQIGDILEYEDRDFPYNISIIFSLFEHQDTLSKTPAFGQLFVELDEKKVLQRMYTRNNYELFEYEYSDIEDFKSKVHTNIGWKKDRENRKNAL